MSSIVAAVSRPALFVDDGGVMNENARRGRQWSSLAGRFLARRLGGAPEAWAAANVEVANRLFRQQAEHFGANPSASWIAYWATYEEEWLDGMCSAAGVECPADPVLRRRLYRNCSTWVTRRVRAGYPGAVAALRQLRKAGYSLHTASGEASWELDGYLTGMRVRDCFVDLYGPDLVNVAKASSLYYQRVFAHAVVTPADAIVVDDSERALDWAAALGAQTVLCHPAPPRSDRHQHVRRLVELPGLLTGARAV